MSDYGSNSFPPGDYTERELETLDAIASAPSSSDEQLLNLIARGALVGVILMRERLSLPVLQAIIDTDPTAEGWARTHQSAPPAWKESQPIGQIGSPSLQAYLDQTKPPAHVAAAINAAHHLTDDPASPLLGDIVRRALS